MSPWTKALGVCGALLFSLCAIPEAWATYHRGEALITSGMLWAWALGEVFTTIYVHLTSKDKILLLNYYFNMLCLSVIIYYKVFPRTSE